MKTQPLKGMRDLLPAEQALRDYIQGEILATYRAAGFQRISTPILEDLENLNKSDGGDNLNLIFKVLKRGEKLSAALRANDPEALADMGLRYDLTLPLSRYYAANRAALPHPFKVIQTDRVYRAERPQKGRLREFVQCDIDILGDESPNAEVELIDVTARALLRIGFTDFTVHINDRRILRAMLAAMGFAPDTLDSVCISFDKLDKIGPDGVRDELTEKACPAGAVAALDTFLRAGNFSLDAVVAACGEEGEALAADLRYVLSCAGRLAGGRYRVAYAPNLVRGQGYYTGMVFEVTCPEFSPNSSSQAFTNSFNSNTDNSLIDAINSSVVNFAILISLHYTLFLFFLIIFVAAENFTSRNEKRKLRFAAFIRPLQRFLPVPQRSD